MIDLTRHVSACALDTDDVIAVSVLDRCVFWQLEPAEANNLRASAQRLAEREKAATA